MDKVRVFDLYAFNIAEKVKFKDTKNYVEKMLCDLGLSYEKVGFELEFEDNKFDLIPKLFEKYPRLEKYLLPEYENVKAFRHITSFSDEWTEGKVYADVEDWGEILDLFTKIPRPFNCNYSRLILDGIDWYGDANHTLAIKSKKDSIIWPNWLPFASNRIMIHRHDDDGNKYNVLYAIVEATTDGEPRDTTDIVEKLEPYFGEVFYTKKICMFSDKDFEKFEELEVKYKKRLVNLFDTRLPQMPIRDSSEPKIQKIVDKASLRKAFKNTRFAFKEGVKLEPGMNLLSYMDSHNYQYEIKIDKFTFSNNFSFSIEVRGYNFKVEIPGARYFGITEEGQAPKIVEQLIEYCNTICDEVAEELAADFGDTPKWYWESKYHVFDIDR